MSKLEQSKIVSQEFLINKAEILNRQYRFFKKIYN